MRSAVRATRMALLILLIAAVAPAQTEDFGGAYSFDEREPRTRVEQVVDRLLPSIVKVHGASGVSTIQPYATGVIVSEQGHILTLDLVMVQRDRTRVVLYDGSVHRAEVMPEDPRLGLRLLKIDPTGVDGELVPLWPDVSEDPARPLYRAGTFVVSLGNSFRLAEFSEKVSATFGVVVGRANTALRYRMTDVDYDGHLILTDAANNPGHYGGGLFTLDGKWIGLNTRLLDSKETNTMISAAIPSEDLLPYLKEWVLGEDVARDTKEVVPVFHGIVLFDRGGRRSPPAYVDRVQAGSPGAEIGLRPDDLIVRLDEFSVRTCKEFREIMERFEPGQEVEVTFKRGSRVQRAAMKLREQPR